MIIGGLINLRALNESDSLKILDWVNNPELKRMIGTIFPVSDLEHKKWFEKKITISNEKIFGIEVKSDKEFIGIIGLKNIDYINSNSEMYMYIGNDSYIGKGLGQDALETLIKFAFQELNLHKVSLEVFSYNKIAKSMYDKVGFVVEGTLKESLFRDGRYYDKILMSILNN